MICQQNRDWLYRKSYTVFISSGIAAYTSGVVLLYYKSVWGANKG